MSIALTFFLPSHPQFGWLMFRELLLNAACTLFTLLPY
jgi:hypothetical protein